MTPTKHVIDEDLKNFQGWYVAILESLYPKREAGFVIATVTFPLLERYLRQKLPLPANQSLNDAFYDELVKLIPELATRTRARTFWSACRNGLLHQATLQLETTSGTKLPILALTHDIPVLFAMAPRDMLLLHPVLFAQRVLKMIKDDFNTFIGRAHIGPALPKVSSFVIAGATVQHTMTVSSGTMLGRATKP